MARKRSIHHHYVPRVLQKNFCFERTSLYFSQKDAAGKFKAVERRNTKSVFQARNHFTVVDTQLEPSDVVEVKVWGSLDNYLGEVLPQLSEIISQGVVPRFSEDGEANFRSAISFLLRRSPDFVGERFHDADLGRDFYNGLLESRGFGKLSQEEQATLISESRNGSTVLSVGRSLRVRSQVHPLGGAVGDTLDKYSVRWVVAQGAAEFVLSSRMVYRVGNGGSNGLENSKSELWLPISPKIAAVLVRDPDCRIPTLVPADWDLVYDMNVYALQNSNEVASHSKELLEFFVQQSGAG